MIKSQYPGEFDVLIPATSTVDKQIFKLQTTLTSYEAPFVHYLCGCNRQYVGDDMYICLACAKSLC